MLNPPKPSISDQVDPTKGDAILKRMLQSKPKTHDEMVKERKKEAATPKGRRAK